MSEEIKDQAPVEEQKPAMSEAQAILSADAASAAADAEAAKKKSKAKVMPAGIAFIRATYNNPLVSIADARGGVISWSSSGKAGFKGSLQAKVYRDVGFAEVLSSFGVTDDNVFNT